MTEQILKEKLHANTVKIAENTLMLAGSYTQIKTFWESHVSCLMAETTNGSDIAFGFETEDEPDGPGEYITYRCSRADGVSDAYLESLCLSENTDQFNNDSQDLAKWIERTVKAFERRQERKINVPPITPELMAEAHAFAAQDYWKETGEPKSLFYSLIMTDEMLHKLYPNLKRYCDVRGGDFAEASDEIAEQRDSRIKQILIQQAMLWENLNVFDAYTDSANEVFLSDSGMFDLLERYADEKSMTFCEAAENIISSFVVETENRRDE